jgi:alkylation response protein AidB-like acyl-CoA dehydrogenase
LSAIRPRDLLTGAVLDQLDGADLAAALAPAEAASGDAMPGALTSGEAAGGGIARDFGVLREAGYLTVALPGEFGGLGCTLRQAACGQRRLAGVAPLTALAVSTHLYWTGAAADAYRSGDESVSWILDEAARGAIFASGHGLPGLDLKFSAPDSRCEMVASGGYELRDAGALTSLTPEWDWVAVHALANFPASAAGGPAPGEGAAGGPAAAGRPARREAVLGFAPPGTRRVPAHRVARVLPAGAPSDVFTTSAVSWGCAVLASVEFSAARRAFRRACDLARSATASSDDRASTVPLPRVTGHSQFPPQPAEPGPRSPLDQWPVAEASLRLDAMKARIADVTHPWPRIPEPGPDRGGQHLISVYAMRREITDGSARVRALAAQIEGSRSGSAIPAR